MNNCPRQNPAYRLAHFIVVDALTVVVNWLRLVFGGGKSVYKEVIQIGAAISIALFF